jgi:predicted DNA-binding protein (UPF0278 family)
MKDGEYIPVTLVDKIFMKYFDKVRYEVSHRELDLREEIEGYEKIEKKLEKKNITEKYREEIIEELQENYSHLLKRVEGLEKKSKI